eukprot:g31905.t1
MSRRKSPHLNFAFSMTTYTIILIINDDSYHTMMVQALSWFSCSARGWNPYFTVRQAAAHHITFKTATHIIPSELEIPNLILRAGGSL